MTPDQIKAICNELSDKFSNKRMAECADVSASTWSDYCNYDKPDITLPLGRMYAIQRKLGRRDFTAAIIEDDKAGSVEATDPRLPAAHVMKALGDTALKLAEMLDDENITAAEKREALEHVARVSAKLNELSASVTALPTGRVRLRAV